MCQRKLLSDVWEEAIEERAKALDLNAKWKTWPELKNDCFEMTELEQFENDVVKKIGKEELKKILDKPIDAKELNKASMEKIQYNDVSNPAHYAGNGKITCKDAFASMMYPLEGLITPKIGYWLGCTFKYIWRAFLKGDPEKDLLKAKQCIDEMLNLI